MGQGIKRAPRVKTNLAARLRGGPQWIDVMIKNVSTKGMMAESATPPTRGKYVEIRRGRNVMVGKVVWTSGRHFGISLAEVVSLPDLINSQQAASPTERRNLATRPKDSSRRYLVTHSDWRWLGKTFERLSITLACVVAAGLLAYLAYEVMSAFSLSVSAALKGQA